MRTTNDIRLDELASHLREMIVRANWILWRLELLQNRGINKKCRLKKAVRKSQKV